MPGTAISPGDVWLTFAQRGQLDRSVYLDLDVVGWPPSLPDDLIAEHYSADHIVVDDLKQIEYLRLRERGYVQAWTSGRYSIWSKAGAR